MMFDDYDSRLAKGVETVSRIPSEDRGPSIRGKVPSKERFLFVVKGVGTVDTKSFILGKSPFRF